MSSSSPDTDWAALTDYATQAQDAGSATYVAIGNVVLAAVFVVVGISLLGRWWDARRRRQRAARIAARRELLARADANRCRTARDEPFDWSQGGWRP